MTISPEQCRAGRALIGWTQEDLAAEAGVSKRTIADFEGSARTPHRPTQIALRTALEQAGVVFIAENGGGPGVRLFKEKLVGWKQCRTSFPGDFAGIQEPFEKLISLRDENAALFSRTTSNYKHEIFLISPFAAPFLPALRGEWTDAENPSLFGWSLLVGWGDPFGRFGLRPAGSGR